MKPIQPAVAHAIGRSFFAWAGLSESGKCFVKTKIKDGFQISKGMSF
ncbi:hypothetical protein LEP1GSC060_3587 [Leptospira weilii serovar Ranarum str. ICFT]|uniref:Uncharacterized protein n=1 Tax=Leptospira weilii serovar Ranarum str. ICFT TaxID=1218598 RepID=N1WFT1_9LEPT|nr:hypothetical protein LEP1GSC060_3587 [Leptospira weilii serovar Ranarum str. ICFT]